MQTKNKQVVKKSRREKHSIVSRINERIRQQANREAIPGDTRTQKTFFVSRIRAGIVHKKPTLADHSQMFLDRGLQALSFLSDQRIIASFRSHPFCSYLIPSDRWAMGMAGERNRTLSRPGKG